MYIDVTKLPERLTNNQAYWRNKADEIAAGIRRLFAATPYKKAVIGLSGGIDSALSCKLAAMALGPENVIAVRLPYGHLNDISNDVAAEVALSCGLPIENLKLQNITRAVDALWAEQVQDGFPPESEKEEAIRRGNLCARMRMTKLMDQATHYRALLMGTENLTEDILAYFTIGGDQVSNVEPLASLWKVEVFQMAEALGLPESVLSRAPSAELWTGQTDEGEIGVSYSVIDTVLSVGALQAGLAPELTRLWGIDAPEAEQAIAVVKAHVKKMDGKRHAPLRIDVMKRLNK